MSAKWKLIGVRVFIRQLRRVIDESERLLLIVERFLIINYVSQFRSICVLCARAPKLYLYIELKIILYQSECAAKLGVFKYGIWNTSKAPYI